MSGGSMNYLFASVENAEFSENTVLRKAFKNHLNKVARALKAIEWNDSGDGDDFEDELIRACISQNEFKDKAISELKKLKKEITEYLEQI
jgi:hypothetical protein